MTTTAPPDVLERYGNLDEQTAAIVVSVFGTDPFASPDLQDKDLAYLDSVITAILAGTAEADRMVAESRLPELTPVDTSLLRARIGALGESERAAFLAAWPTSGAPTALADTAGESVVLSAAGHLLVDELIAQFEPAADPAAYEQVKADLAALPSAARFGVVDLAKRHGVHNVHKADDMTAGRLATLAALIAAVPAEPDYVAGSGPDGTVDEVVAWVDGDPARAALALNAEERRAKPRKGLLVKLAQTAGVDVPPSATPPSAPPVAADAESSEVGMAPPDLVEPVSAATPPVSGGDDVAASSWVAPSPPDMLHIADRLVTVTEELNQLVELLTGVAVER